MHKIIELIADRSAMPAEWVTEETKIEDLDIESLEFIELIFEIETACDVKIPATWDADFSTVGDIIKSIDLLKNSEAPASE